MRASFDKKDYSYALFFGHLAVEKLIKALYVKNTEVPSGKIFLVDIFATILQNIRMWVSRKYESTLKALFTQFPVVVLTGARQVGKTSLARRVFPDCSYVSLDLPSQAAAAEQSPETFLRGYQEPVIIDEVQYAPSIFRHIKTIVDQDKRPNRFLLTGSQNFLLMQGVAESLAGRCGVLNMLNLSLEEVTGTIPDHGETSYLSKGGYPELYSRQNINPHFWFVSYLSTYLERDVRNILNVGNLRDFERLLRALAMRTGQILSYSELARDVGIAPNTAKKWISVLQTSGQIFLLEPYYRNLGKRLVKSPKLYMCDIGMAVFLMGFESWGNVVRHPVVGALWETHVVMEVVKYFYSRGKNIPLWFWRTGSGEEVDLLVEQGARFTAIEAKYSEQPGHSSLRGIKALKKMYGDKSVIKGYVASRTSQPYPVADSIIAVPGGEISKFL
ncbi:MAG: AAA family ATPase [Thermodesulfobacteriota bacterium]|nr:AAA family ATPase [Thermodesulfobacteriota bacterium]